MDCGTHPQLVICLQLSHVELEAADFNRLLQGPHGRLSALEILLQYRLQTGTATLLNARR